MSHKSTSYIIPIILILGIIGLAQQILAGRILTPEFGNSVYTWGSIIGIFMVALSLGYHFGGKISQKSSKMFLIQCVSVVGAINVFLGFFGTQLVEWVGQIPLPPQYAVLPAVILLFGPSTFIIGLSSPIGIELLSEKQKGKASSKIFTVDTIGSIIGAFGATFFLIPTFSVSHSFYIVGLLGLICATIYSNKKIAPGLTIIFLLILIFTTSATQTRGDGLYYTKDSVYQNIEVFDENGVRFLYLDNHPHSAMFLDDITRDAFAYTIFFDVPFIMTNVQEVLFIGGGGFTGPRKFVPRGVNVSVVELDQEVVNVAKRFFHIDESQMNITVSDGREYLRESQKQYDVIYLDAYRKDKVPFHLATKEFYEISYESLDDEGILFTNIIGYAEGINSDFFRSSLKTIQSVFPSTYTFLTNPENPSQLQNILVIATKEYTVLSKEELLQLDRQVNQGNMASLINTLYENIPIDDVQILTDEYAPVDELLRVK